MADRITGFGRTIEEFEDYECVKEVHEIYNRMTAEMQNDKIVRTLFGSLSIDDVTNIMTDDGVDVCELDEYGFELLGKCVGIPSAYLKRLNDYMKIVNIR